MLGGEPTNFTMSRSVGPGSRGQVGTRSARVDGVPTVDQIVLVEAQAGEVTEPNGLFELKVL